MTEPSPPSPAELEPSADFVFLSYASVNREAALAAADALEAAGVKVWIDRRGLSGGVAWAEAIATAVRGCSALALFVTPASVASRNVRQELQLAWDLAKPILPLLVELTDYPDAVAYFLHGRQWVEVAGRSEAEWVADTVKGLRLLAEHAARPVGAPVAPPLPAGRLAPIAGNLPTPATDLVGRETEVARATALLGNGGARLLTLTGPGGVGKTRLSLAVAEALRDGSPGGAWFVDLAPLADPALVLPTIARALGEGDEGDRPLAERVATRIGERQTLLVLDNMEHLMAAAPTVADLLSRAPSLRVLATSRMPLRLKGEREIPIAPLPTPKAGAGTSAAAADEFAAVRLFVARAQAVAPEFALTDENAASVATICARLDGLPLAIELAAARVRLLTPDAMLARLTKRLPLLTGGARDLPARQRTLQAAIAWSHDLLGPDERSLFQRLAVFAGGWTIEAAEAVAADPGGGGSDLDVLDGLGLLAEHSLVRQTADAGSEPRFGMLETIREYGLERLEEHGQAALARDAHAAHFLHLAEEAKPQLTGADQVTWLDRLESEHDNLRAALTWWGSTGQAEETRLAGTLWRFWWVRGYLNEGRRWLEGALERGAARGAPPDADALFGTGAFAEHQSDFALAGERFERAAARYREVGDALGVARALGGLGNLAINQGAYRRAEEHYQEALDTSRAVGDERAVGVYLSNLAAAALLQGNHERAINLYAEYLAVSRQRQDPHTTAMALFNLAETYQLQGNLDRAEPLFREAMPLFAEVGDDISRADALAYLGRIALAQGDAAGAGRLLREGLALFVEAGDKASVARCLEGLAAVAGVEDDPIRAARLFGAAEALREAIAAPLAEIYRAGYDRDVDLAHAALDWKILAAAWEEGRSLGYDGAIVEANGLVEPALTR
ncbi:MAG: hypothetical protein AVDCRST_MAG73-1622 [uncultured Thermomicrobiales bacterium]|uniref:TIR domain-containing protein n=1 Tax=uncultured Thermomicrobiales bacterium TaxID=1645740 RepID=A0A6J4U291_9BACT|nr:MAG: hypothetical protein AVDCRST_MAG73-1622 [uncultured Thermomicrobiales bacterium]